MPKQTLWATKARHAFGAARVTSTGGVEDPAHLSALDSQFVVFSNGFFSLQDSNIDTFLLHKVQSGGGNLREETAAQTDSVPVQFAHNLHFHVIFIHNKSLRLY